MVTRPNSLWPQLAIEVGAYGWPRGNIIFFVAKMQLYLLKGDLPLKNANGTVAVCVNLELQFIHLVIMYYCYHVLLSAVLCRTHVVLWFGRVKMYYTCTHKNSTIHEDLAFESAYFHNLVRSCWQTYITKQHTYNTHTNKGQVVSIHGEQNKGQVDTIHGE
jgi:hypothetical protein